MKHALVTGANRGIGYEIVKQLAREGYFVYLGCRTLKNGIAAVKQLAAEGLTTIEAVELDVANTKSVEEARKVLGSKIKTLDVLINNAGISGDWNQSALTSAAEQYHEVFETNVLGVIRTTQAFIDLLRSSSAPRIVNVSTAMASLTQAADLDNAYYPKRYVIYQSTKAALNMYTVNLAFELRDTSFKVNAVCPGWTKTDFTGHQGTSTVDQAAQRIIKYALIDNDGPTGKFFSEEYFPAPATIPW